MRLLGVRFPNDYAQYDSFLADPGTVEIQLPDQLNSIKGFLIMQTGPSPYTASMLVSDPDLSLSGTCFSSLTVSNTSPLIASCQEVFPAKTFTIQVSQLSTVYLNLMAILMDPCREVYETWFDETGEEVDVVLAAGTPTEISLPPIGAHSSSCGWTISSVGIYTNAECTIAYSGITTITHDHVNEVMQFSSDDLSLLGLNETVYACAWLDDPLNT